MPSAAAWRRRDSLPRINPAVDSYNAVSVRHGLPAGAFDLDHVTGNVEIRYADGTETFTPLGEPDTTEHPRPGEIIYTDTTDVLTRHWNHRDAHRTRVTENSTHVAFVLETLHAARDGHLLKTAAAELQELLTPHTDQTQVLFSPGNTRRPPESGSSANPESPAAELNCARYGYCRFTSRTAVWRGGVPGVGARPRPRTAGRRRRLRPGRHREAGAVTAGGGPGGPRGALAFGVGACEAARRPRPGTLCPARTGLRGSASGRALLDVDRALDAAEHPGTRLCGAAQELTPLLRGFDHITNSAPDDS
jgi:hypothetical protein